ncbi:MAG: hypothetical protein KIT83_12080 [Bryobacterales bacterium]|nr:hypothetical protein [Bryobacterales bacterium]
MPESSSRQLPPRPESASPTPAAHARRWPWILPWILAIAVAAIFSWTNIAERQQLKDEQVARVTAEAEAQRLRNDVASLRSQLDELETEMETIAQSGNLSAEAALRRQREIESTRRAQSLSQQEFEVALANAGAQREVLAERIVQLENSVEQLRDNLASARAREENLRESVEHSRRLTEALQTQIGSKDQAYATLERAYQSFKDSSQSGSRQLETISRTLTDLEEINQRRARILEQATRRLKDLSDSYRTVAVRIDSDPRTQGTLNAEVNRLQSGVLAVEDQVAQFNTLNTQASQLERRLSQLRSAN